MSKTVDFSKSEYEYIKKIVYPKIQTSELFKKKKLIFDDQQIGQPHVYFRDYKTKKNLYSLTFWKFNNNRVIFLKDDFEYQLEITRYLDNKNLHGSKRKFQQYRYLAEDDASDFGDPYNDYDKWTVSYLPKNLGSSIKKFLEFLYKKKFKNLTEKEHLELFELTNFK